MQRIRRRQSLDANDSFFGGVLRGSTARPSAENAGGTPADIVTMVCLYLHPQSQYYLSPELVKRLEAAVSFMQTAQGRDGLISMDFCNFDSPPDTAFVVVGLAETLALLRAAKNPNLTTVQNGLEEFLKRTERGLVQGGVHTPNHRWVMAGALVWLSRLFDSEQAKQRALEWLREGVDCSAEGEWTERSSGVYNVLCNIMFWQLAQFFDDDGLLEPVRRNLDAVTRLVQPSGLLVTEYSTRQDKDVKHYLDGYYLVWRLLASQDNHGEWAWWSDRALELMGEHDRKIFSACTHELLYHMRYPQWMDGEMVERQEPVHKYERSIPDENGGCSVVRFRRDDASLTLVTDLDSIGSYHYGNARLLSIRPTVGYFGKAVFVAPSWTRMGEGVYVAVSKIKAPYYAPLSPEEIATLPPELNPVNIYESQRTEVDTCYLTVKLTATVVDDGLDVTMELDPSVPNWPVLTQLALTFGSEGMFEQDFGLRMLEKNEWLMEDGWAVYRSGSWVMDITQDPQPSPAHQLRMLRGDTARLDGPVLLINGIAGHPQKVKVRCFRSGNA